MSLSLMDFLFRQGSYDGYVREKLAESYKEIFFDDDFYDAFWETFGYCSFEKIESIDIVGFMLQYALDKAKEEIEISEKLSQKDKEFLLAEIENVSVDSSYGYSVYVGLSEFLENIENYSSDINFENIGKCCKFARDVDKFGVKNLVRED